MAYNSRGPTIEADDSSFYLFVFAVLLFIVVPWVLLLLKRIISHFAGWEKLPLAFGCNCINCSKVKKYCKDSLRYSWLSKKFAFEVLILLVLIYFLFSTGIYLTKVKTKVNFDPYDILHISPKATEQQIKTAYRKLAVQMHPDKHPGDPKAVEDFILINKAYECLTDEKAKSNYLKYGDPDGPVRFTIGIGLPSFILKEENRNAVLIIFFTVLLILIPGGGYWIYKSSFKYNSYGIYSANIKEFFHILKKGAKKTDIPRILSYAKEYHEIITETDETLKDIENAVSINKSKDLEYKNYKIQLLIEAYLKDIKISDKKLIEEQQLILNLIPRMLSCFADSCNEKSKRQALILPILKFSQVVYQGISYTDSPYLQLPFFTKQIAAKIQSKMKLKDFIRETPDTRKLQDYFQENEVKIIENAIGVLPQMEMKVSCFVKDEEEIHQGDILTIKVEINIKRSIKSEDKEMQDKETPYSIHSNKLHLPKQEVMWIILESKQMKMVIASIKIHRRFSSCSKEFMIPVFNQGKAEFIVYAKFDCYRGLDCKEIVTIKAKPKRVEEENENENQED